MLEKLNDKQLKQLLWRSDVYLEKFRKEMFFKLYKEDNNSHSLLSAVSSHHFDLDNELDENLQTINEFGQILSEYQSEKLTIILSILLEANDLNPVIKLACGDCLETLTRNNVKINDWHHQFLFKKYKENIYRDFKNKTLEKSFILAIKLYNLAKKVVPWDKEKTGSTSYIEARQDLCFLLSSIHAKQTWATYQSFHEAWYADYDHESKNHLLPELTSASLDI